LRILFSCHLSALLPFTGAIPCRYGGLLESAVGAPFDADGRKWTFGLNVLHSPFRLAVESSDGEEYRMIQFLGNFKADCPPATVGIKLEKT
jgi:hypothetical protein